MFGNFDVAILGLERKGRFAAAADQHVDLVNWLGPALLFLRKIIGDFTGSRVCDQVKCRVGWNISECVSVLDGGAGRELKFLPPFVGDREIAGLESEVEIAETIVGKQPAVAQLRARFFAPHSFDQHFAIG